VVGLVIMIVLQGEEIKLDLIDDALQTAFIISQGLEATAGCPYGMAMHSLLGKIHPQVQCSRVPERV